MEVKEEMIRRRVIAEIKDVKADDVDGFDTRGGVDDDDLCVKPQYDVQINEEPVNYNQFDELWQLFNQEDGYDWKQQIK